MSDPTTEQIARLPKWAQDHLNLATRQRDEARKELADYLDSQTESKVYTGYRRDNQRFIQDDRVHFIVPNGEVTVQTTKQGLECMASYGNAEFIVKPHSSNVILLEIRKED